MLGSRESLLIVENMDAESERYEAPTAPGTDDTKSVLFVPLVSGGKAMGLISLESLDEHAFGTGADSERDRFPAIRRACFSRAPETQPIGCSAGAVFET